MKIIVLIKEVPDMEKVKFDTERKVVDRSSASAEMNPFDESALAAAIDLKETCGAEVTVMTMGPARAAETLKDAYARGADRCVLITDRTFGGADTYATAKTLAAAIETTEWDLILCGEKSVDGDTAQVGAEVAQLLDIPHTYYVDGIEVCAEDAIRVSVENIGGNRQIRKMGLPALVSVTKNAGKLKLPTVTRKLASLSVAPERLSLEDLADLKGEQTGLKGSPTKVAAIEIPAAEERNSRIFRGQEDEFFDCVREELFRRGIL